jgi:hypothetical protein
MLFRRKPVECLQRAEAELRPVDRASNWGHPIGRISCRG